MAKNSITDYSKTASLNTDIQSVDIDEGCLPSGINNAIREIMADLAAVNDGTVSLTSPSFSSVSLTGDLSFGDSNKAIFGAGSDLQIYHDGSDSYIRDVGTGVLAINTNAFQLANAANTETIISAVENGQVTLYHDNSAKLATTSTGIDVTGTVTADGLNLNDGTSLYPITYTANSQGNYPSDVFGGNVGYNFDAGFAEVDLWNSWTGAAATQGGFSFHKLTGASSSNRLMRLHGNNDISFYEDTGTTAKLFWDASEESLGIGTSSPTDLVHLKEANDTATSTQLLLHNNTAASGSAGIAFQVTGDYETTSYAPKGAILFERTATKGRGVFKFMSDNVGDTNPFSAADEVMRIDSLGNLLVGTTGYLGSSGVSLGTDGVVHPRRSNNVPLIARRDGSDGDVIQISKDGTTVGSIGSASGVVSYHVLDPRSGGVGIMGTNLNNIIPTNNTGTPADNAKDLGIGSQRWRNLYLGGGVYFGGFYDANKLDDYEEGTWTPNLSGFTGSFQQQRGRYIKIGAMVYASFHLEISVTGGSGGLAVTNLPFTAVNSTHDYGGTTALHCNGWATTSKADGGLVNSNATSATFFKTQGQVGIVTPTLADLGTGNMLGVLVYESA